MKPLTAMTLPPLLLVPCDGEPTPVPCDPNPGGDCVPDPDEGRSVRVPPLPDPYFPEMPPDCLVVSICCSKGRSGMPLHCITDDEWGEMGAEYEAWVQACRDSGASTVMQPITDVTCVLATPWRAA